MISRPLVSVAMITYNHSSYIAQALDSVLAQRRDFPIEIVISDDCSPDGTGKIIDEYQRAYPDLFRRLDPPANLGAVDNFNRVWQACSGKYIAVLDGDDWWHDPEKLATQVSFMEAHPECTVCGHKAYTFQGGKVNEGTYQTTRPEVSEGSDLTGGCLIITCSAMYRHGLVSEVPDWLKSLSMADWPLLLLHGTIGKIGYINKCMSTYRVHEGGVWSVRNVQQQLECMLFACKQLISHFPKTWRKGFHGYMSGLHSSLFILHRDIGNSLLARYHWMCYCYFRIAAGNVSLGLLVKAPIRLLFPGSKRAFVPVFPTVWP